MVTHSVSEIKTNVGMVSAAHVHGGYAHIWLIIFSCGFTGVYFKKSLMHCNVIKPEGEWQMRILHATVVVCKKTKHMQIKKISSLIWEYHCECCTKRNIHKKRFLGHLMIQLPIKKLVRSWLEYTFICLYVIFWTLIITGLITIWL